MSQQKSTLNTQIVREAAEWFVEMDGDDADRMTRQRFDEWLRRSPEHVRAFLELLPIWEQGARRSSIDMDLDRLIADALSAHGSVVPLNARSATPARTESNVHAKPLRWAAAAASVLLIALVSIVGTWLYSERNTYSTGIGEQRSVALVDGSSVTLNTRSRIRVRYSEQQRQIDLLEGQVLFEVAHEEDRPFIVQGGDASIRAVGTQFDVYRQQTGTTVTVVEGRITILPEPQSSRGQEVSRAGGTTPPTRQDEDAELAGILLAAGEQATITPTAVQKVASADVAATIAWTRRRLMFQKTTLGEVVREFNRYNERPLRIEDPRLKEFLVSGTFSSTDPNPLLRFLRAQPGMRVVEAPDEVRIESTTP